VLSDSYFTTGETGVNFRRNLLFATSDAAGPVDLDGVAVVVEDFYHRPQSDRMVWDGCLSDSVHSNDHLQLN